MWCQSVLHDTWYHRSKILSKIYIIISLYIRLKTATLKRWQFKLFGSLAWRQHHRFWFMLRCTCSFQQPWSSLQCFIKFYLVYESDTQNTQFMRISICKYEIDNVAHWIWHKGLVCTQNVNTSRVIAGAIHDERLAITIFGQFPGEDRPCRVIFQFPLQNWV